MIKLSKGEGINLTKSAPSLSTLRACLGWDVSKFKGQKFDLDVSVFALNRFEAKDGEFELKYEENLCFYHNKNAADGALQHSGDNRNGQGEGDDETVKIDLTKTPSGVVNYSIIVTIDQANERNQHFGMVDGAYIRLIDDTTQTEICRYDLTKEYDGKVSLQVGSIYKDEKNEWVFKAIGFGYSQGLEKFIEAYHATHLLG